MALNSAKSSTENTNIIIVILVTSLATYLSRFLGVVSAEKIKETSKMFRWFNCLAYSTLAALIARIVIFPTGVLSETDYFLRIVVIITSITSPSSLITAAPVALLPHPAGSSIETKGGAVYPLPPLNTLLPITCSILLTTA